MSDRKITRGQPRPVDPAWKLSPGEIAATLARPHFLRFIVVRRPRRHPKTAPRRISN